MTIDTLPPAPVPTDSAAAFDAKAFAFAAALDLFGTQANALGAIAQTNSDIAVSLLLGMALPTYGDTSSTSLTIGTGTKVFTTSTGKAWVAGQTVVASNGANYMKGLVTSYSGSTLTVSVATVNGSGTFASWSIGLSCNEAAARAAIGASAGDASGVALSAVAGPSGTPFTLRNKIINGGMSVNQRDFPGGLITGDTYIADRWVVTSPTANKFGAGVTGVYASNDFGTVLALSITSAGIYTPGAAEVYAISQKIEATNIHSLMWGTFRARPVTVSFMVKASSTGVYGGSITNEGGTRSYPFSYTINVADEWERKAITIPGDTGGYWLGGAGVGMRLSLGIGVGTSASGPAGVWASADYRSCTGAYNVLGAAGAFYVADIQLEEGSLATPFERLPDGMELDRCRRYYYQIGPNINTSTFGHGVAVASNTAALRVVFPVKMRTAPTGAFLGVASDYQINQGGYQVCTNAPSIPAAANVTTDYAVVSWGSTAVSFTIGMSYAVSTKTASGGLYFDAEWAP